MPTNRDSAALILDDGTIYHGQKLGHLDENGRMGEIVFNTSMSGYQEIITDPSYMGQMVCFTYPSIGNYGINNEDNESDRPYLDGIIVRDYCDIPSNFRSAKTLEAYLLENQVAGITGVDTRALVRHIREKGAMRGGIFAGDFGDNALYKKSLEKVCRHPSMEGCNLTDGFNGELASEFVQKHISGRKIDTFKFKKICVLDFGIKFSILKHLLDIGLLPVVFPGNVLLEKWPNFSNETFSGYFLSNGPGDPASVVNGIENIRKILSFQKPVFGICLGHQMLAIALGAKTYKLKFGHHGGNQPVKTQGKNRVIITAQNHGFSVEDKFFSGDFFKKSGGVCEVNPNDQTIEGFFLKDKKILSVQYHPEAGPGPNDALEIFSRFKAMLET
ncbi:MAG: glutamine-hydrolyzing carbamoyl-phosphate synthase small subunit [Spirochaetia bacterium]|nr:glutamine-hydrolyzing carbamoyl-phosphate synthase small subunit [Spirochaetia bacterium]